jgi:hypothetical protein
MKTMKVQMLILFCTLVFAMPLLAGRDKSDVIVMNNGDRLTGEIKGLNAGVLYVSFDYMLGTVSLDWSKVKRIESKQSFVVKTENGSVYRGALRTPESTAQRPVQLQILESPQQGPVLDRSQIIQVNEINDRFWQRFNGQISSGIVYSKANRATEFTLGSSVMYPRERWRAGADFSSSLSSSTGAPVATRNLVDVHYRRLLRWDNWFYTGLSDFLQSSEQKIQIQSNVGFGVGRYLKNTNSSTIAVLGGLAWQNTRYSSLRPFTQNVATSLVAAEVKLFKFDKTNLNIRTQVFPALSQPGRVFLETNATYYIKLIGNLTWDISFYGNWDNQPPARLSGNDYGTSVGLGWTFGNK